MHFTASLALRNLTAHPLRSILTALAITLGVGMVLAAAIVGQAASQSASQIAAQGPQIALEIYARDDTPFDQAVLALLDTSPFVERASPSLHVPAQAVQPAIPRLMLLGIDAEAYAALYEPEMAAGDFFGGANMAVLPPKTARRYVLRVGDALTLLVPSGQQVSLTVAGQLETAQGVASSYGVDVALVPLALAQTLAGAPGQIDHVAVALQPDADVEQVKADLAQRIGPALAVVRAVSSQGVMGNVLLVQVGLAIVGLIILLAAGFVILNAFAMSVTGRTREIGALRALGMTRRQVMRTVLAEAGLLGLLGVTAGVGVGLGLAWAVMRALGTLEDTPLVVQGWGLLLSAALGLGVTLAAALQPAWRAGRVSPIVATRPEATVSEGWYARCGGRIGAALLGLMLTGTIAFGLLARPDISTALPATLVAQSLLLGATVLLLPGLVSPVAALARPLLTRWLGAAGRLAADNLARNKLRTALTAGAMVAGLTIIVATSGLMTAGLKGSLGRIRASANEDGFVTGDLGAAVAAQEMTVDNFFQFITADDHGFDLNPVVEALQPLVESGVIAVERCRFLAVPPELAAIPGAPGLFVDPEIYLDIGNFSFFEGDVETARRLMQRGRAMLLTPIVAERLGVQVGDAVPLRTPHGEIAFTVAGIGGGGFLMTVFSYADGVAYFDVTQPSFLGIVVQAGQDNAAALSRVQEAIAPFPDIMLHDYSSSLDPLLDMVGRLELLLDALLLLAVIVAALGVVNTLVINVAERRREIGLLRAVGATQRQVRQALVAEAATLGLLAALVAAGLGLLMLLTWGLLVLPNGTASLGIRADWQTIRLTLGAGLRDWSIAAAVSLFFGPLVAALAAYYPARQAAAMDVVEATRSERVALRRSARSAPRKRRPPRAALNALYTLARRNLNQARTRTILSALAVALGVAMTVAADVTSNAILNALASSRDAQTFMAGLLDQLDRMLVLVGIMIACAAGFLVLNAFAMAVTQRRQQIGALRALGTTRRQVMQLMLVEALLIGGTGTLLGLLAGPLLGRTTIALIEVVLGEGVFIFAPSSASPATILLAAALGLGVTLLSVLLPARQATRISPLEALRQHRAEKIGGAMPVRRALLAGLIAVALAVYLAVAPPGEWVQPPWDAWLTMLLALVWLGCLGAMLPVLIGGAGRGLRRPLTRLWGATGRLMADNLRRGRGRVTVTALTLAVALTTIVGISGFMSFMWQALMRPKIESMAQMGAWMVTSFDFASGMTGYAGLESLMLPHEAAAEVEQAVRGRAGTLGWSFAIVPELSFWGDSYFSFVMNADALPATGVHFFDFLEGDWPSALPIMRDGCGVLVAPSVAARNGVSLGDTFAVTGRDGPVSCTVAGIGSPYVGASIVGAAASDAFDVAGPIGLLVWPLPGSDRAALEADLHAVTSRRADAEFRELDDMAAMQIKVLDALPTLFNALLLLAVAAAALGVVNTTVMSVAERRRELGLLRAAGATRRQVSAVVVGEAALIGLLGSGLGWIAGVGVTVILAVTYGGNGWGLPDLDLWAAAWQAAGPALLNGLLGLLAAPPICAAAAWPPVRAIVRGPAIETLRPSLSPQ